MSRTPSAARCWPTSIRPARSAPTARASSCRRASQDRFLDRLIERTKTIRIGDPLDPETQMGPLISKAQHEKVTGYIAIGKAEGATLASWRRRAVVAGL